MVQKIYTKKVPCAICLKTVEEYNKEFSKSRTIKSWLYVCMKCWREMEKEILQIEKRVKRLENKIFAKKSLKSKIK